MRTPGLGCFAHYLSGWSVSLSSTGNTVAIGAPGNGSYRGHVRVYDWNGTAWNQRGSDIDGEVVGDQSGISVSLSSNGNTVAIGAYFNDGPNPSVTTDNRGHLRVYDWNSTTSSWVKLSIIVAAACAAN